VLSRAVVYISKHRVTLTCISWPCSRLDYQSSLSSCSRVRQGYLSDLHSPCTSASVWLLLPAITRLLCLIHPLQRYILHSPTTCSQYHCAYFMRSRSALRLCAGVSDRSRNSSSPFLWPTRQNQCRCLPHFSPITTLSQVCVESTICAVEVKAVFLIAFRRSARGRSSNLSLRLTSDRND